MTCSWPATSLRIIVAAATSLVFAGCAGAGLPPGAPVNDASPPVVAATSVQSGEPDATDDATAPTSPATATGAAPVESASALLLGTPPAGWVETPPRDSGGYRMTVCGVDLEPTPPVDTAAGSWRAQGVVVEQHVRVYSGATATEVRDAIAAALPGCTRYTATDDAGGSTTFAVGPLTVPDAPEGAVSWRQRTPMSIPADATATGTAAATPTPASVELVQDVVLVPRGAAAVLFVVYGFTDAPGEGVLAQALAGLD